MSTTTYKLKADVKTISIMIVLMALPNLIGMVNLNILGFKIHFFQYAIFLAAMMYGPVGGALAGGFGSIYSMLAMSNPFIFLFNAMLGFLFGTFYKGNALKALGLTLIIQLPFLYMTDLMIVGLPSAMLNKLIISLTIMNIIWVFAAKKTKELI